MRAFLIPALEPGIAVRQTGPVKGVFSSFELAFFTSCPRSYLTRPLPSAEELAAAEEAARPLWVKIWYQKSVQIGIIGLALLLLPPPSCSSRTGSPGDHFFCTGCAWIPVVHRDRISAGMRWDSSRWSMC